jgi:hypothetical protein
MNAQAAARITGLKIHDIRHAPEEQLPYSFRNRIGLDTARLKRSRLKQKFSERVYRERDVLAYAQRLRSRRARELPEGELSAGQIAEHFNVITATDRLGLQWALRDFREAYPDKVKRSKVKGILYSYSTEVLDYLEECKRGDGFGNHQPPSGDRFTVPARNKYFLLLFEAEGTKFYHDYRAIQRHWDSLAPPDQRVGSGRDGYDIVRKGVQQAIQARRRGA